MAVFPKNTFRSSSQANSFASKYRAALAKHPFALFGLPFIFTCVAGSFFLTPATAIRYEKHDRRVRRLTKEEELSIGKSGRKVDMKEEYYRLAAKDLDDWEQKRVKRLPGEVYFISMFTCSILINDYITSLLSTITPANIRDSTTVYYEFGSRMKLPSQFSRASIAASRFCPLRL